MLCPLQFSPCSAFYPKITLQFVLCVSLAVEVALLEIMLKQYCLSERVINHQVDKGSGHCWRVMSVFLTFNTFGLLLVTDDGTKIFCMPSVLGDYMTLWGVIKGQLQYLCDVQSFAAAATKVWHNSQICVYVYMCVCAELWIYILRHFYWFKSLFIYL